MKKLLFFVGALALAISAEASYLYWQVPSSSPSGLTDAATYAHLVYYASGTYGEGSAVSESNWYAIGSGTQSSFNLTDTGTTGAYFIELSNYDTANDVAPGDLIVGHSEGQTYSALSQYISESMTEVATATWSGGSYTVPEPTSGMLMMFALAILGLKRKKA